MTSQVRKAFAAAVKRFSPLQLVAVVAVLFAFGGTATAALLITGKDVKDGSLSGADIRDGSIGKSDLANGIAGADGKRGPAGPAGPKGDRGKRGKTGARGLRGKQGPKGAQGEKGERGAKGETGAVGPAGPQGAKGDTGATGAQGPQGPAGATGAQGPKGDTGAPGADGAQGPQGPVGPQGPQGENGLDGLDGAQGPQGERGPAGALNVVNDDGTVVGVFTGSTFDADNTREFYGFFANGLLWRANAATGNLALHRHALLFTTPDCTGPAYVVPQVGRSTAFIAHGQVYRLGASQSNVQTLSFQTAGDPACNAEALTTDATRALEVGGGDLPNLTGGPLSVAPAQ